MSNKKLTPITRINKSYNLYGLYCPYTDELRYIGITTGLLSTRLCAHLKKPTNDNIALWFKTLKKDDKIPIIKLIREYASYEELLEGEINEIRKHREKTNNLLNIADGGYINPMFGKTHSDEAKLKISKTHKGRKLTDEQVEKRKELLAKLWSDEEWSNNVKHKMRNNMLGNKRALGFKHSEETKKKLSAVHSGNTYSLGFKHSEETKKLMSINNSGENNPMFGKRLSEEILKNRSEKVKKAGTYKGKNNANFKYHIPKEELIKLYLEENLKIQEIADYYGCNRCVISKNIKNYNIIKPTSNKYNLNIDDIIEYRNKGLSLVEIGNIYGCSNKIIHKFIKKHKNEK